MNQTAIHCHSDYITVPDGTRLVVSYWLDSNETTIKCPAVVTTTRYWRALQFAEDKPEYQPYYPSAAHYYSRGYVYVVVDVRGTGASFGGRETEISAAEIADMAAIIDWVSQQPWCDGQVATEGNSYSASTTLYSAIDAPPPLKLGICRAPDFDGFRHLNAPGGIVNQWFLRTWGETTRAMDNNDPEALYAEGYWVAPGSGVNNVIGVRPVDNDKDGTQLALAVAEHRDNYNVKGSEASMHVIDNPFYDIHRPLYDPAYKEHIEQRKLPLVIRCGWHDAGTQLGALSLFASFEGPLRIIIDPWNHVGNKRSDPLQAGDGTTTRERTRDDIRESTFEWLDRFLKPDSASTKNPAEDLSTLRGIDYYTLGKNIWQSTDVWPLPHTHMQRWYLSENHQLSLEAPTSAQGSDEYQVDPTTSTGRNNRWFAQAIATPVLFPDRREEDQKLLVYDTPPLQKATEITGHPVVHLQLSSSASDGQFFVYLETVDPDGRVRLITDGQLRGMHRKVSDDEPEYTMFGPYHSLKQQDAEPMVPGEVTEIAFDLLPVSIVLNKGQRIRVAIAGADKDVFAPIPGCEAPSISVQRNSIYASFIDLPLIETLGADAVKTADVQRITKFDLTWLMVAYLGFVASVSAGDAPSIDSYYANSTNVYWGDTHLHTNLSMDATIFGNRLGPDEAYRFAKGEAVLSTTGRRVRLQQPLDFLVIADHAINMGVINSIEQTGVNYFSSERERRWAAWLEKIRNFEKNDPDKSYSVWGELAADGWMNGPLAKGKYSRSTWQSVTALADRHNTPGLFTAFIGYEWTAPFSLHRVVVFKDDAAKVNQVTPFSADDDPDPESLWQFLKDYENQTGGEVMAIPHNSNRSSGVMFALQDAKGKPLSKSYAKIRSRWEPLLEVTQIKGDSETHPALSPTDEFADYETIDEEHMPPRSMAAYRASTAYKDYENWYEVKKATENNSDWMRTYEYARSALKLGLKQQAKLGINPFKFGMIGSTDSHTSLATADENNFWGKFASSEPDKSRILGSWHPSMKTGALSQAWKMSAAGYVAVWAEENTRDSLFAAMKRKEVYATTGPRIKLRFFGGWNYHPDDLHRPNIAAIGYRKGVPMGGDLLAGPIGETPTFLIHTVKDPDGANLDRVQVIKGWLDSEGELHEKVYNVVLSDGRKPDSLGTVKPLSHTVDLAEASYTNSIGDSELAVVWHDPDFNKDEFAFYYVRVLEIPTPRWTAYDAKFFSINNLPDEVPMITQERAYSSPIWYSPAELLSQ